jgi:putative PIN family toxin of toxin-antitoxin system
MKIVLDANVVIAAFAARGLCESVLELCLHSHQIVLSEELLDEIQRNLRNKIKLPASVVDEISKLLIEHGDMLEPASLPSDLCRDPDDVMILGLAIAAHADFIVTGDQDLLVLNEFRGIPIMTPRSFPTILHNEEV